MDQRRACAGIESQNEPPCQSMPKVQKDDPINATNDVQCTITLAKKLGIGQCMRSISGCASGHFSRTCFLLILMFFSRRANDANARCVSRSCSVCAVKRFSYDDDLQDFPMRTTNESLVDVRPLSSELVKVLAQSLGFDLVGIAPAMPLPEAAVLRDWIARGYAGEMQYLVRRVEERCDPQRVLPGAKSAIVVGFVYHSGARPNFVSGCGRVSRYAGGEDYHDVLLDRLRALEAALEARAGRKLICRSYVDTGPVQERMLAVHGGLGWIGKNACLIHPKLGSYFFLGILFSDLELELDAPIAERCGTCTACLDVCPTQAIVEPHVVDARRCISYTTIESKEGIPSPLRAAQGAHVFGCDLCQEVCPWNRRPTRTTPTDPYGLRAQIWPRYEWQTPTLHWLLELTPDAWRTATHNTAMRRSKYRGLMRNVLIAAGNSGDRSLCAQIEKFIHSEDEMLVEHAQWALARIDEILRAP